MQRGNGGAAGIALRLFDRRAFPCRAFCFFSFVFHIFCRGSYWTNAHTIHHR